MGLGRLFRMATVLLFCVLKAAAAAAGPGTDREGTETAAPALIELRKSFRPAPRPGRQTADPAGTERAVSPAGPAPTELRRLNAAAAALGESLQSSGTLRLPGIGGRVLVLEESITPVFEFDTGHRAILDAHGAIAPAVADEISRTWPGFAVVRPAPGDGLRGMIGGLLDAAGYESVLRAIPLTFGRGVWVRFTPDFLILRTERDLLDGETRAVSVVEDADALPAELRELAAEQRVRVVELTLAGLPAGSDHAPWRDPSGRVTTMGSDRLAPLLGEIAAALGLTLGPPDEFSSRPGDGPARSGRVIRRGETAVLVLDDPDPGAGNGQTRIALSGLGDLTAAVGALLRHFGMEAIGPTVELHRAFSHDAGPRFVIGVPGWLAQVGNRRLLITGAELPQPVRLFLTREGLDIFEYRSR